MDIMKSMVIASPMIIASLVFAMAAAFKAGREKGSILVLFGTIGLFLMALTNPIIYTVIMPRVIENMEPDKIEPIYLVLGLILNICWAGAIILISVGIFLRPVAVRQPYIDRARVTLANKPDAGGDK